MRLTDEENTAESGIDIVASPPGKKLQNVLLLSGGEKALTALSLLVGIFQYQPSPFCVLDEVDAPLDETNVGRLAEMLKSMSDGNAVRCRDPLQAHDDRRGSHLWRHHAGAGCVQAGLRPHGRSPSRAQPPGNGIANNIAFVLDSTRDTLVAIRANCSALTKPNPTPRIEVGPTSLHGAFPLADTHTH